MDTITGYNTGGGRAGPGGDCEAIGEAHWHHLKTINTSTTGSNMFFQLKVRLNIHINQTEPAPYTTFPSSGPSNGPSNGFYILCSHWKTI